MLCSLQPFIGLHCVETTLHRVCLLPACASTCCYLPTEEVQAELTWVAAYFLDGLQTVIHRSTSAPDVEQLCWLGPMPMRFGQQSSSLRSTLPAQHVRPSGFLLLVQRSGTHCPKTWGIRSVLWTVTDSHWRHFYFRSTIAFSALEVCYDNALYKSTFDIDIDIAWDKWTNFGIGGLFTLAVKILSHCGLDSRKSIWPIKSLL